MTKVKILLLQRTKFNPYEHVYTTDDINCSSRAIIKKISFNYNDEPSLSEQFMNSEIVMDIDSNHDDTLFTYPKKISLMTLLLKHLLNTGKNPVSQNKIKLYPDLIIKKEINLITNIVVNSNVDCTSISITLKIFDDKRIKQKYNILNCNDDGDYDLYETKFIIYMFPTEKAIKFINVRIDIKPYIDKCDKLGSYDLYVVKTSDSSQASEYGNSKCNMSVISLEELIQLIQTNDIDNVPRNSIESLPKPDDCEMFLIL